MKQKLTALSCVLFLILFSYTAEFYPSETRTFLWHAVVVAVLEALLSTVDIKWPGKRDQG